ncbi:hypothetical protein B484DRAFT_455777 [Ochromonadaceae sp. CCMP2298]|nr:hypothetical protein B484DRAFT_455777 [Ochromonadaceae sp. CCMP2298]|mmetsp:Transcript_4176/g.9359  ORF Transcript_4176/g.9359 Transcript_4176/m.9359 type:complete len:304 (-) Transcript_4176:334-1245(-)
MRPITSSTENWCRATRTRGAWGAEGWCWPVWSAGGDAIGVNSILRAGGLSSLTAWGLGVRGFVGPGIMGSRGVDLSGCTILASLRRLCLGSGCSGDSLGWGLTSPHLNEETPSSSESVCVSRCALSGELVTGCPLGPSCESSRRRPHPDEPLGGGLVFSFGEGERSLGSSGRDSFSLSFCIVFSSPSIVLSCCSTEFCSCETVACSTPISVCGVSTVFRDRSAAARKNPPPLDRFLSPRCRALPHIRKETHSHVHLRWHGLVVRASAPSFLRPNISPAWWWCLRSREDFEAASVLRECAAECE